MSGNPNEKAPSSQVDLPDAIPDRVRQKILTGRSLQNEEQTNINIGI